MAIETVRARLSREPEPRVPRAFPAGFFLGFPPRRVIPPMRISGRGRAERDAPAVLRAAGFARGGAFSVVTA